MTEKYAEIRAALDATEFWNNGNGECFSVDTESWADASNPLAIRALLAERDALLDQHHRDSKELRRLCAQRDAARKVSKEAGAVIAALKAERDALRVALEDELIWHEAQDKAISKQPDANTGHSWWRRAQHQEHAVVIRAALGQGQEES